MRCLVLIGLVLICGWVQAQVKYQVKGQVTDNSGEAIAFSTVYTNQLISTTDAKGRFSVELPSGNHDLTINSLGYNKKKLTISVPYEGIINIELVENIKQLGEVVVTATRTSRSIDNVPVPVNVISSKQIQTIGSLRLNEVLQEQTGLQITSDHGTGVMMQGLSSDYILFLIDGEPVIGRTAGTLELNRLAVDNIERVEIIKGPSSSLYGSEAMAGVVNIITKKPIQGFSSSLRSRYRSYQTLDVNTNIGYNEDRLNASLFIDRLSTAGYDLTEESVSMTAPPFQAYTFNPKFEYRFSDKVKFSVNSRLYIENQENTNDLIIEEETIRMVDKGERRDWNVMPTLALTLNDHQIQFRSYTTGYATESTLRYQSDGILYEDNYFDQLFNRSEIQYDYYIKDRHITTLGLGHTIESVDATRYDDVNAFRANYGFMQHQWIPGDKFNLILGGRFDIHSAYASRFSPKLAAGYTINNWLKLQASVGGGYKAPDFRQLLLNFTNPVAGYSVVGSSIVKERMKELESQGQVEEIFIDPGTIQTIEAESSLAYNAGLHFTPGELFSGQVEIFRNEINNLIDTAPIARKTNGQNVFSYFNFDEVVTQGVELNGNYRLMDNLNLSLGYQYLDSRNLEDISRIRNGEVFRRNPGTNRTEQVQISDYGGLINRSRHSGNAKIFYENKKYQFDMALRSIYRGKWGIGDSNGNGLIDMSNEYANGYLLINLALNKSLFEWLVLEAGSNNLLDIRNEFESSLPGRIWYVGVTIDFSRSN